MNKDWTYSPEDKLNGCKCLRHKKTKELTLAGKYGEIWIYSEGLLSARVTSHKIANKLAKHYGKEPNNHLGDEAIIKFPYVDLIFIIKTLMIPKSQKTQLKFMEKSLCV